MGTDKDIRRKDMEEKYGKAAREILSCVGGEGNIVSAAHCATRLRLVLRMIPRWI